MKELSIDAVTIDRDTKVSRPTMAVDMQPMPGVTGSLKTDVPNIQILVQNEGFRGDLHWEALAYLTWEEARRLSYALTKVTDTAEFG